MIMTSLIRRTASSLCFNSRNRHFFTHPTHPMEETGLYGCKHLKTPKGFRRLLDEAIERSNELVRYVSRMPSSSEIVNAMGEILNIVSQVEISAGFCGQTHPDSEFVDEALKALRGIRHYQHNLYTNLTIYNAILKVDQDQTLTSIEAKRFARDMLFKHENHGIHLSAEKKDRVSRLKAKVDKCRGQYYHNIDKESDSEYTYPTSCLPKNLRYIAAPVNRLSTILEKRQRAYIIENSGPRANVDVIDNLLAARHEISQIMGYKSYADYIVQSNMASSPDVVSSFLDELGKTVKPKAVEEFQSIRNFKKEINGEDRLEPWDNAHFQMLMVKSAYNLDFSVIASYFSLTQSIEGLKVIVKSLFGMKLLNCPLAPGESWHPDVTKMSLHHPDEGDLGYIYLDLISREGKDPDNNVLYTIRQGCRVSKTEYQLPVVAITCNFLEPCNSAVVRLTTGDVKTLFHEFGHALDSLLSRTDHQFFSGARAAIEIVETPSQLFEYYASDYRVLKKFARHYSTGDTIPEKLVDSIIGYRKMFEGMELQRQIFYSSVDQALFGIASSRTIDSTSIVADLTKQHTNWEHVKGIHYQARFTYLLSHSAEYYGYLYGKCFASTIWEKVCKEDPLSLETGTVIRTKFLQHCGTKDPAQLLQDLGGDGIIRYQNEGGIVPDITSLCNEMNIRN